MYTAMCGMRKTRCASRELFRLVWRPGWCKALRFRKKTTHTCCSTCDRLKTQVLRAASLRQQVHAQLLLIDHLQQQWSDRAVYWGLRERAVQVAHVP